MEMILINDNKSNIVLYLNNKAFYGYRFNHNNTIEKLDNSIFNYFDFLYPSNNYTKIGIEDGYQVILDNETNLKHYIKNGSFDIIKFFNNNGDDLVLYNGNNNDINKQYKYIRIYNRTIKTIITVCISLSALLTVELYDIYHTKKEINELKNIISEDNNTFLNNIEFEDLTKEDISKMIYNSKQLSNETKEYLNNEDLFEDILPYVNSSNYMKYMYNKKFMQISIEMFDEFPCKIGYVSGYYNPLEPNKIYLRNKTDEFSYSTDDTLSHEFIHLCQLSGKHNNVIEEATAEIYSYEYFDNTKMDTYQDQIRVIKKLMEIIGTEPIKRYIFTGDFSLIDQSVKPYLTNEEYKLFLESLHCSKDSEYNCKNLDDILAILYNRIYNDDINNNKIINLIDNDNNKLVRYYFNPRLINQENSYYYDTEHEGLEYFSYEEAYEKGIIKYIPNINENNYKIDLLKKGFVDYDNEQIVLNMPSKVYIKPIQEYNYNLKK